MHRSKYRLPRAGLALVLGLFAAAFSGSAFAESPRVVPVVDGSGALGQATGPNGSMNGNLYVPERQATHPRSYRTYRRYAPRRYSGRGRYREYPNYRHYRGYGNNRGFNRGYRHYGGVPHRRGLQGYYPYQNRRDDRRRYNHYDRRGGFHVRRYQRPLTHRLPDLSPPH